MKPELPPIIDSSWTLFLDRDGVINVRNRNGYITRKEDFVFIPGVLAALKILAQKFSRVVVVTNQQGIGKGLYSHEDLSSIHDYMRDVVVKNGGRIDAVYYAPQLSSENSPMRKPEIGMALAAKQQFPEIDFSKSIMVGDTQGDMTFARNAGMLAVLCTTDEILCTSDLRFNALLDFASYIAHSK
jgi:D,D-heptose 1,7-bisphosphate phosphatase